MQVKMGTRMIYCMRKMFDKGFWFVNTISPLTVFWDVEIKKKIVSECKKIKRRDPGYTEYEKKVKKSKILTRKEEKEKGVALIFFFWDLLAFTPFSPLGGILICR